MQELFTPGQVAAALGVSESSLKRWCDRGRLHFVRTCGGHRRLPLWSVVRFVRESGHRLEDPKAIQLPIDPVLSHAASPAECGGRFSEALLDGDERTARSLLVGSMLGGSRIAELGDGIVAPAMQQIGALWESGRVHIYEERRACELCYSLLVQMRMLFPPAPPEAPLALGGTPAGDPYSLANALVDLVFREQNWRTSSLGTSVSLDEFLSATETLQPRLVWLSVSHVQSEERFLRGCRRLLERLETGEDARLVFGGRGISEGVRAELPAVWFGRSLAELEQELRTLSA